MALSITEAAQDAGASGRSQNLFIGGQWVPAKSGGGFETRNPTTGAVIATCANGTADDADAAIAAARAAQHAWEALPPAARAEYFYAAAELFKTRQQEFCDMLVAETGSGVGKAMFECSLVPLALREAAALTTRSTGEALPSNVPGKQNIVRRRAAGVVATISPWNFPLYLSLRGFIYAMALGNTVVLKPSEDSPLAGGAMIADLFEAVGLPPGVLNLVTCGRDHVAAVGSRFVEDPRVDRISFTGSTNVGRQLSADCATLFKKIILEMGGKNPIVVLEDADLDYAVDVAFFGSFLHQGQICMSADKIIVARPLYDAFVDKLVAKVSNFAPLSPDNEMSVIGPIINERQLDRIHGLVTRAREAGAQIHLGGEKEGPFYRPTVITDVSPEMDIYRDEIFGPVALVIPADSEEEAIAIANDSDYGLSAAIVTRDVLHGEALAPRIHAGMVHINDSTVHDEPHCPFGGMKSSGWFGKWGGDGAIDAFTEQQWISRQVENRAYPF